MKALGFTATPFTPAPVYSYINATVGRKGNKRRHALCGEFKTRTGSGVQTKCDPQEQESTEGKPLLLQSSSEMSEWSVVNPQEAAR